MMRYLLGMLIVTLFISSHALAKGAPRPARIFSDHMVLQCDQPVPVWGRANPSEPVIVAFGKQRKSTDGDANGNWRVMLDPMPASSTPQMLLVASRQAERGEVEIRDVLVGEVWFCAGQSNMFLRLRSGQVADAEQTIKAANHPLIRMSFNHKPWEAITPQNVTEHSAVAYFTARELHEQLNKPIGIITLAAGGRALQSFFEPDQFNNDPANADIVAHWAKASEHDPSEPGYRKFLEPCSMAGFLQPLYGYGIRGVFWYQGEAEAARDWAPRYRRLYPQLIQSWRTIWENPDMPFYCVQLPAYGKPIEDPGSKSAWAEVRDALAVDLPWTGFAVTYDIKDTSLHPQLKREVGQRLARVALESTYKLPVAGISPRIEKIVRQGKNLRVSFAHIGSGLKTEGDKVHGFAIADADGNWTWADVRVDGKTVLVSTEGVSTPIQLRFAWADNPVANLLSQDDLPVAPFQGSIK